MNDQDLLDYEMITTFELTVRIGINEYSTFTLINVTVHVQNVNEPPKLAPQRFIAQENCLSGALVGPALSSLATDPEDDMLTFRIDFDGTNGLVLLNAASGQLSFNFSTPTRPSGSGHPIDFETAPASGSYLAIVEV